MAIQALVTQVDAVRPHGDNLSIVTVGEHEVVANRKEDGSFRWSVGEPVIYVPEGALIPPDVLQERGYWDGDKDKGLLEGKKGNRVKMRRFAGVESRGLLFKIEAPELGPLADNWIVRRGASMHFVTPGSDVAEFLGITEYVAA